MKGPKLFVGLNLVFLYLFGTGTGTGTAYADPLSPSARKLVQDTTNEIARPRASERSQVNLLGMVSRNPALRAEFVHNLAGILKPEDISEMRDLFQQMRKAFPESPVSHGFAGGYRTPMLGGLLVTIHWFNQGYYGTFAKTPEDQAHWQAMAPLLENITLVALGIGALKDGIAFSDEYPSQREWKRTVTHTKKLLSELEDLLESVEKETQRNLPERPSQTIAELGAKLREQENRLSEKRASLLKSPRHFMRGLKDLLGETRKESAELRQTQTELAHLVNSSSETELAGQLQHLPEAWRARLDNPGRLKAEEALVEHFGKWLAANPGRSPLDLIDTSFTISEERLKRRFSFHSLNALAAKQWFTLGLFFGLWGAYTNTTADPQPVDRSIFDVSLSNGFRKIWYPYGQAALGALSLSYFGRYAHKFAQQRASGKTPKMPTKIALSDWDLVRRAALRAALLQDPLSASNNEYVGRSSRQMIEEALGILEDSEIEQRRDVVSLGSIRSCAHILGKLIFYR